MIGTDSPGNLMRRSVIAAVVGALLLAYAPTQAEELLYARFADYLEALRVQTGIPGLSAAVVGRTDVLWERGFGYQDVARALVMRPDTPMQLDGLTQTLTAATVLRCAEDNRLSLDDTIGGFKKDAPDPGATLRQLLSHTSGPTASPTFVYRPERLDPIASAIKACQGNSYRETTANLLDRLAMEKSVPGPDVLALLPPAEGIPSPDERERYAAVLDHLAIPYAVDGSKRVYQSQFSASTLTASSGVISTVHDYAQFDLALRSGLLVTPDTLAGAWRPGTDNSGKALPHGLGWFVQSYNADTVVWQFGTGVENGSSSLVVTLPARGVTLILMANSTGLAKSFQLEKGDVTTSPFARVFLSLFTR
jgi:CubicO group peptidase (beta-lactamase class C family)